MAQVPGLGIRDYVVEEVGGGRRRSEPTQRAFILDKLFEGDN